MDMNCPYCSGKFDAFGIKICDLSSSMVYLFKEQSHKGRVIVAHKNHVGEMLELTPEERADFIENVNHVAVAVHKAFNPDKVNYGAYSDTLNHLHFHLVPKYKDGYEWGGVFAMNPKETLLTDAEYDEIIAELKKYL